MFNRKHLWLIVLFICFIASSLGGNYLSKYGVPSSYPNKVEKIEVKKVSQEADIIFGAFYLACDHLIKETPKQDLRGLNLDALLKIFPSKEGWVVDTLNPQHIIIYQKKEGLCPADSLKSHLGISGDYVAVYRGPIGLNGGIERVTDIRVDELPAEFKEKIKNGDLDFANEAELMDALDTMDEYDD